MVSVALVGPDGAGKTTIAKHVAATLPIPARYLYMGDNPSSANRSLGTTRLWFAVKRALGRAEDSGPPEPPRRSFEGMGRKRRMVLEVRGMLRLVSQLSEEWYRAAVGRAWERKGFVVIRDRDFFVDYYAHDISPLGSGGRTLARTLHGALLAKVYPRPDLVVCLEAPPALLLGRKGEGSVDALERRAEDYRSAALNVKRFITVDAAGALDDVVNEVSNSILRSVGRRTDAGSGT